MQKTFKKFQHASVKAACFGDYFFLRNIKVEWKSWHHKDDVINL